MKQVTAQAIAHKDVSGKELYYLKITNGTGTLIVNVGIKTFTRVKELEEALGEQETGSIIEEGLNLLSEETTKDETKTSNGGRKQK